MHPSKTEKWTRYHSDGKKNLYFAVYDLYELVLGQYGDDWTDEEIRMFGVVSATKAYRGYVIY